MTLCTIAVGIIRNAQQQIFIAQRAADAHMGGFWEFPGGKMETGETPEQALTRELLEETGIVVAQAELLATSHHQFAEKQMAFYFYLVEQWHGTPYGKEGQPVRWCPQAELLADEFPPANAAIIRQLIASQ
ncbi:8-oxo-dGTP diphosphatase MutT [Acerihabitans sp. TG2]|uniref:8-oxo-dGTP diphosphatase MutT n=1 Tax=Acerihabitans sp. TG2 TaxID=3096008 RepID=UPI002B230254|nr:8-oxo-dGTP diphosphatase MutT [Acerihabitans sp. TG2]MEA9391793.1 8-oxo-dGTP diphosphatase MutT [Acerihabitans sp. TG2]